MMGNPLMNPYRVKPLIVLIGIEKTLRQKLPVRGFSVAIGNKILSLR